MGNNLKNTLLMDETSRWIDRSLFNDLQGGDVAAMKNLNKIRERNLQQILVDENLIAQEHLESALEEQSATNEPLITIVLRNDYVDENDLAKSLVKNYQLPFIYPQDCKINKDVKDLLPNPFLHTNVMYPLDVFGKVVVLVTSGSLDENIIQEVERVTKKEAAFYLAPHNALMRVLNEEFPLDEIASELNNRMDELFGNAS
jgi:hypothetical protein